MKIVVVVSLVGPAWQRPPPNTQISPQAQYFFVSTSTWAFRKVLVFVYLTVGRMLLLDMGTCKQYAIPSEWMACCGQPGGRHIMPYEWIYTAGFVITSAETKVKSGSMDCLAFFSNTSWSFQKMGHPSPNRSSCMKERVMAGRSIARRYSIGTSSEM